MANFVLLKNLVSNPNVSGELNNGFSWIQKSNEVWCSEKGRINYSSDFGVSFITVYDTDSVSPGSKDEDIWLYEHNGNIYSTGNEVRAGNEYWFRKWNGFAFDDLLNVVSANVPIAYLANVEFNSKHYIVTVELGATNDIKIFEQNGDSISLLQTIVGDASFPIIAIFEFSGDLYLTHQIGFTDSEMFKLVGASFISQFTTGGKIFAAGEFSGDAYYYERGNRDIGTINMVTGALTQITTIAEAAQSSERSYFKEVSGELNLIIGTAVNIGVGSVVYAYAFNGAIFNQTYLKTNTQIGDAVETASKIVIGQIGNSFYENECNIFYEGFNSTNETNVNADDGTITHIVNTDNAVGTVEYRLLDGSEVEVVTWQVSALFENLVPGVYLLESRDDDCLTRFVVQVSVLEFQSNPAEQQPSRSRDYLNSPNFTRFRQIFGMSLNDFQALNGELPPPIDEVLPVVPPSFVYSVTVSALETISLPMFSGDDSLYDFTVNFGDGSGDKTVTAYADTDRQHEFTLAGTYDIRITRQFDRILFADSPDSIIELKSFGPAKLGANSFLDCVNFTTISAIDTPLIHLTSLVSCFEGCSTFNGNLSFLDTSIVTNMDSMFIDCIVFDQPVTALDTSSVTTMSRMFQGCAIFNQLVPFDTSACTDISLMFEGCSLFNQLLTLDLSIVTTTFGMFQNCTAYNQVINFTSPLLTTTAQMFFACAALNKAITIDTSSVTTMVSMFRDCIVFNQSLTFDTSSVETMARMFQGCTAFNKPVPFNTVACTDMSIMFESCVVFNQAIGFNTALVTTMATMFQSCPAFDQDLSALNITALTVATNMLLNTTLSTVNYDALLIGWEGQVELTNVPFHGGNALFTKAVSAAETARSVLIATSTWTITDGGPTP